MFFLRLVFWLRGYITFEVKYTTMYARFTWHHKGFCMNSSILDFLEGSRKPTTIRIYRKDRKGGYIERRQDWSNCPGFSCYIHPYLNDMLEFCNRSLIDIYGEIPDRIYYSFENSITP